ncbi:MAG: hypothetical protein NVSMB52_01880 [Chloroflexota bacterium]
MKFVAIRSLRWQLVLVMCMAYVIGAAATEIVGYTTQQQNLRNQLEMRARADAIILAAGAVAPLRVASIGDSATLRNFVTSLTEAQGVSYAAVYGDNGCRVASTLPVHPPSCIAVDVGQLRTSRMLPNGDVEGRAAIAGADTQLGTALVILSGQSIQTELHYTLVADSLLRGAGLLIFLLLSLAIAQYILGPLADLARAALAIRHGDMKTRVPAGGRAELATVGNSFNEMAEALEQRIKHLSFLAAAASVLPRTFRDREDVTPTLKEFCQQLGTYGAGLIPRSQPQSPVVWYDVGRAMEVWEAAASSLQNVDSPEVIVRGGYVVIAVPVLGDTIFVTVRSQDRPYTQEEQQVITNFAYQVGIAADNARLFESQQEALQVKDQFLSIVSHELRTPLTTIKGYSQMLRRRLSEEPNSLRFALNIEAQVGRLSRLVDDLLDVTRYSRGQFELKRQYIDLRPVLDDAVARFRVVAPKHMFSLHLDQGPFEGNWDRDRLEQVMNNLVGNAVKYSPQGGEVIVSTRHENGTLVVAIRDHGQGIPERDQQQLFERFFRGTAEGGDVKGLGLGLYVTRRIVEAHGGTIGVWSKQYEGSEFSFTLPLVPAALSAPTAQ